MLTKGNSLSEQPILCLNDQSAERTVCGDMGEVQMKAYRMHSFGCYIEGVGTLKASGGDLGGQRDFGADL